MKQLDEKMVAEMTKLARKHNLKRLRIGEVEVELELNVGDFAGQFAKVQQTLLDSLDEMDRKRTQRHRPPS